MGKINVLPFAVANLIAAGEVVDRPASVIKELVENAIDAGASHITVEIQNGGVTLARVTDNGCGMEAEEVPVAIRRHATSKIKNAEDLEKIMTLGFRGEALAAIAAVSDLRILSKTADAPFGTMLEAHGGEIVEVREQGCPTGTSVIVENLFANVPARRKFLKKDTTEAMAVTANVEKIALSHPEIAFHLIIDGITRIETAGDGNLHNTVYAVFGKEFASRLIPVESESEGITVSGFIGRTDNFKGNRNYQNFFINGRYVKSKTAMAALEQAYTSYMPPEKFPACVINIGINPMRVDVNVHPAKLEVKFSNEKPVFEAVYYTVRSALENNATRPAMQLELGKGKKQSPFAGSRLSESQIPVENGKRESLSGRQLSYDLEGRTQPQPQLRMTAEEYRAMAGGNKPLPAAQPPVSKASAVPPKPPVPKAPATITVSKEDIQKLQTAGILPAEEDVDLTADPPRWESAIRNGVAVMHADPLSKQNAEYQSISAEPEICSDTEDEKKTEAPALKPWRIVGEVFRSYVLVEAEDKLLIIDKHAAHERILFESLKAGMHEADVISQMLLLPVDVMMTSAEVEALREYEDELEKIGFSLRYARNTVSADAIPQGIESAAVGDMLQSMAARILTATGSVKLTRDIIFEKALYQAACKAAIKAGREYAEGHIQWLVEKLMSLPDITFCPHGRPVAMELSHHTLDKQFDRTGF